MMTMVLPIDVPENLVKRNLNTGDGVFNDSLREGLLLAVGCSNNDRLN